MIVSIELKVGEVQREERKREEKRRNRRLIGTCRSIIKESPKIEIDRVDRQRWWGKKPQKNNKSVAGWPRPKLLLIIIDSKV